MDGRALSAIDPNGAESWELLKTAGWAVARTTGAAIELAITIERFVVQQIAEKCGTDAAGSFVVAEFGFAASAIANVAGWDLPDWWGEVNYGAAYYALARCLAAQRFPTAPQ